MILESVLLVIFLPYIFFISYVKHGLLFLKKEVSSFEKNPTTAFSIIVATRNDGTYLERLLRSFQKLDYPRELFEIIVVNDRSTDDTSSILNNFQNEMDIVVRHQKKVCSGSPKKSALTLGINMAKHEVIITTDGDCIVPKNWLKSFHQYYKEDCDVVAGLVDYLEDPQATFFQRLVAIDFLSLVGFGAGFIGKKVPLICNGANFSYKKSKFQEVEGFKFIDDIPSGDDDLLLHKFHRKKFKISYNLNAFSIVKTESVKTVSEFIKQRKRWGSKGLHYKELKKKVIMYGIFFSHVSLLVSILYTFFNIEGVFFLLFLFLIKWIFEYPIMKIMFSVTNHPNYFKYIPLLYLFQAIHVVVIGILANISSYEWK